MGGDVNAMVTANSGERAGDGVTDPLKPAVTSQETGSGLRSAAPNPSDGADRIKSVGDGDGVAVRGADQMCCRSFRPERFTKGVTPRVSITATRRLACVSKGGVGFACGGRISGGEVEWPRVDLS